LIEHTILSTIGFAATGKHLDLPAGNPLFQPQHICEEDTFDPPTFPPEKSVPARSNQFTFNFGTGCA